MARFTVVLPEGFVLLRNQETGETLRLSAEAGPLTLGELEMTLTMEPAPAKSPQKASASETTPVQPLDPHLAFLQSAGAYAPAAPIERSPALTDPYASEERRDPRELPPGFGPNLGEPFLSPAEPIFPSQDPRERPFMRVLDAPLDALTAEDFDLTLEALALRRNNIEGEIEYLEEIEAEPSDIEELEDDIRKLDEDFSRVVQRKAEFDALPKKREAEE